MKTLYLLPTLALALWSCRGQAAQLLDDRAITLHSAQEIEERRHALIQYLWGAEGFPAKRMPDAILTNVASPVKQLANLERVDEFHIEQAPGLQGLAYHFVPQHANQELVVVHHGHACTLDDDAGSADVGCGLQRTMNGLLREGFGVLGVFMPHMRPGDCTGNHEAMFQLETAGNPMKFFLESTAVSLNCLKTRSAPDRFPNYRSYHMVGLSGGGWTTTVYAAIDPTIRCSFPVAGTIPLYLRAGGSIGDREQFDPPFYKLAGYPDLYILGAQGVGRKQVQILNVQDDCCFGVSQHDANLAGMPYEAAMREYETRVKAALEKIGSASFRLEFDRTAPAHMISHHAIEEIILPELRSARSAATGESAPARADVVIHAEAFHSGRINPRLFGNFVELLDDVAPALWAEMLNDRSFEGVRRVIDPVYFDGAPNFCDREWDRNATWNYDNANPFNGAQSARLTATNQQPATLTQSDLAVKKGLSYTCSGWFRADQPNLQVMVSAKTILPTGEAMTLASAKLPPLSPKWQNFSVSTSSIGETDRAFFELRVEGEGNLWADKLSLMPDDNLKGWRKDVIAAIKDLHPTLLRWGGSVCDPGEYRWKASIGDRDQRTPFTNKNWGRLDSNDVGIDEFCQLCELAGTEPLVCLSFSDGPQSAGDLVEYCNGTAQTAWGAKRAASGHPEPYRVRYWQIGNEISGDDPKYLEQFPAFVESMKKADAGVVLMSSFPSRKLLERAGKDLAYICPHHYTRDFAACERELSRLTEMIDSTPEWRHLKIAVTEWNESGGDWGLMRGRQMTLSNALHNAAYLNVLMRHSDKVEIACRSSMANSFCGGVIDTSPFGLLKRPGYYALQLYARHAKPIPLRLESPKDGPDLFACASEDRKAVVIFAVNSKPEPCEYAFGFTGFNGPVYITKAESLCDTLNARQPDVMNHWETPNRIKIVELPLAEGKVTLPPLSITAIECAMKASSAR
jgi:alpha-N-arabinofuranosidase